MSNLFQGIGQKNVWRIWCEKWKPYFWVLNVCPTLGLFYGASLNDQWYKKIFVKTCIFATWYNNMSAVVAIAVGPEVSICPRQTAHQPCLGSQVMEQYKSLFFTSPLSGVIDSCVSILWMNMLPLKMYILYSKRSKFGPDTSGPLLGHPLMHTISWDPIWTPQVLLGVRSTHNCWIFYCQFNFIVSLQNTWILNFEFGPCTWPGVWQYAL